MKLILTSIGGIIALVIINIIFTISDFFDDIEISFFGIIGLIFMGILHSIVSLISKIFELIGKLFGLNKNS